MNDDQIPKYYRRFFHWFCHPDFEEELAGDLEENFILNQEKEGLPFARQQYRKEVLQLFRPSVIKELRLHFTPQVSIAMIQNYFKIAIRNLKKDKVSALINIFGLSVGFACSLFIILFAVNDLTVDTFFDNGDRVYRVINDERPYNENGRFLATTAPPFAPTLAEEYPEVESAVRLRYSDDVILKYGEHQLYEKNLIYADKDFFQLFSFPLAQGDPQEALLAPNSIVLTPQMAQKYFGNTDPMGKTLLMDDEVPLHVTGVLQEDPQRTHLNFDFLISFNTFKVPFGYPVNLQSWGWISFHTYLLLQEGVNPLAFNDKLAEAAKTHIYADRPVASEFRLQALSDIYFHSNDLKNTDIQKKGNLLYTYGLVSIAFLILLIAGFNFMNINTARSIYRAKEVGVRKVLGAQRGNLISQFLGEALVNSLIGLCLALFIFELFRNQLLAYLEWDFTFAYSDYVKVLPVLFILAIVLGILSAIYPALLLSRFKAVSVLKGKISRDRSEISIRKILVVCQFAITVGLIICSLVLSRQMDFIRHKKLGYNKEQVVSLQLRSDDFLQRYDIAKRVLSQNPYVQMMTAGDVINGDYGSVPMTPAGADEGIAMHMMGGYFDYFSTLGIEMIAGRDFSTQHPSDTTSGIIINESALRKFGWENPIGQQLQVNTNINGEVIGVVKDFHFLSLHNPIEPLVIVPPRTHMQNIILRTTPIGNVDQVIASLQKDWQQIAPDLPFQFSFLDDNLEVQYEADRRFSKLIGFFSWIAIFIAGLGLYGLISIITAYKIKEIGIRKTLGASIGDIFLLLSKNFLVLIFIANLIALPSAWWLMNGWLQNFTYHAEITVSLFLTAVLFSFLIALFSLSYQVLKSAMSNPIHALRNE